MSKLLRGPKHSYRCHCENDSKHAPEDGASRNSLFSAYATSARKITVQDLTINNTQNYLHFSICACRPCAGAILIFSVSFGITVHLAIGPTLHQRGAAVGQPRPMCWQHQASLLTD